MSTCQYCNTDTISSESGNHRHQTYSRLTIKQINNVETSYYSLQNVFYDYINDDFSVNKMKDFLQHHPSIITETDRHPSPLVKAANLKFSDIFDIFVQYVDVNTLHRYSPCETPLMCAVKHNYSLAAMRLIEAGANVFHRCLNAVLLFDTFKVQNCSLLHLAVTHKSPSIGYFLIEAGCDIFSVCESGKTSLFYLSNIMKSRMLIEIKNRNNILDVEIIKIVDVFNEILERCMTMQTDSRFERALAFQYSITNYLKGMSYLFCAVGEGLSYYANRILETSSKYGYPNTCYLMLKHGADLDTAIHYFYKGPYITGWHSCEENPEAPHLTCFIVFLLEGTTEEHIKRSLCL